MEELEIRNQKLEIINYRMKQLLSVLIVVLSSAVVSAQTITGKLIDEKGSGMAYANVSLLKASDTVLVTTVITAKDGNFSISGAPSPTSARALSTSSRYWRQPE
jgi:arginine decarboxylase-like protein